MPLQQDATDQECHDQEQGDGGATAGGGLVGIVWHDGGGSVGIGGLSQGGDYALAMGSPKAVFDVGWFSA